MYKDKEKANQAAKERMRRYRAQQKGVTSEDVTEQGVTLNLELCQACNGQLPALEKPRRLPGLCLECVMAGKHVKIEPKKNMTFADLPPDVRRTINDISRDEQDKAVRTRRAIHYQEHVRVG